MNLSTIKAITIPEGAVACILVGDEVIWKTKKIITTEDTLVKNTGAILFENTNLVPSSYTNSSNTKYFTFKEIPIEPGATYYSQWGTRSWFLDSGKKPVKTVNIRTVSDVAYQFTVPDGVFYISIAYNYASSSPDTVGIRKVL